MRRSTISFRPAAMSNRHSLPSLTIGTGSVQPFLPTSIMALASPDMTILWLSSQAARKVPRRRCTSLSVPGTKSRQ
jgi:hypothetical protein